MTAHPRRELGIREDIPNPVIIGDLVSGRQIAEEILTDFDLKPEHAEVVANMICMLAINWSDGFDIVRQEESNAIVMRMLGDISKIVSQNLVMGVKRFFEEDRLIISRALNSGLKPGADTAMGRASYHTGSSLDERSRMPSFSDFVANESRKARGDKQDAMKKDITSENSLANAVWPVIEELNKSLNKRKNDPDFFTDIRQKLLTKVNDEKVSASLKTRRKWTDVINKSRSLVDLSMAMYNMWLKASGLGVDRGKM